MPERSKFFNNSFNHLTVEFYFTNLLLVMWLPAVVIFLAYNVSQTNPISGIIIAFISLILWFLYPFSRYAFSRCLNAVMGGNIFLTSFSNFILLNLIAMVFCYIFAFLLAPVCMLCFRLFTPRRKNEAANQSADC